MSDASKRALVFDLGKVLIDFSVERACTQISRVCDVSAHDIKKFLFDDGLEYKFEAGEITFSELHDRFESHFGINVDQASLANAASDIFSPIEQTIDLIQELNQKHRGNVPFILLSNTNEIHWAHIESQWKISRLFDHLILSFERKAMKPDKRIYLDAVARAGIEPSHCFFTDDIPENVAGARATGLDAELYEGTRKLRQDLQKRGFLT